MSPLLPFAIFSVDKLLGLRTMYHSFTGLWIRCKQAVLFSVLDFSSIVRRSIVFGNVSYFTASCAAVNCLGLLISGRHEASTDWVNI